MQANLQARQAGAAGARSCRQSLSTATHAPPTSRGSRVGLRAASGGEVEAAAAPKSTPSVAAKTYSLELKKPVGLVFAQKSEGGLVYVDEITPGGNADKTGKVQVGDKLIRCSAYTLSDGKDGQQEGYGERLYSNWEKVNFDCRGQSFKDVMGALKSNSSRMGILTCTLTLQRDAA